MDQSLINEPDASRLIFGLRDTGYNFRTAAADIIDNSIAANADEVHVRISMTPEGRKFVYFGVVSRKPRNFRQPINMACLALGR